MRLLFAHMLFASLLLNVATQAQTILEEKVLENPNVPLKRMNVYGVNALIKGAGGSAAQFTPSLEVANLGNDGFIVRKDLTFTKYNDAFEKQWEKTIEKVYSFGDMPDGYTIGNSNGVYFIQIANELKKMHVTRFDAKGSFIQKEQELNIRVGHIITAFVDAAGFHAIVCNVDSKKFVYSIITFAASNLAYSSKPLALPVTAYENEEGATYAGSREYAWSCLVDGTNKLYLEKSYFKDVEGTKKSELVIETAEVGFDGTISKQRSFAFGGTSDNNKYKTPNVVLDTLHNELYVLGGMAIESKQTLNGMYVSKYDYTSGIEIYKKEMTFDDFTKHLPDNTARKEAVRGFFLGLYDFVNLEIEEANQVLKVQLKTAYRKLNEIKLDKYGDIIHVAEAHNPPGEFYEFALIPEKYEVHWKAANREHLLNLKSTSMDYLYSLTGKVDPKYLIWSIIPRKDFDILVSIKESNSEVKAYKIKY